MRRRRRSRRAKAGDAKAAHAKPAPKVAAKAADAAPAGRQACRPTRTPTPMPTARRSGRRAPTSRSTATASASRRAASTSRSRGFGSDREYDSFESFVQDAPWLAGLVFLVVLLVFLVPLLIIVLLIWYKVRKNRMLNETMLKLAEKGVVPPAEAMAALDANRVATGPTTTPLYEQAKQIRQRARASDLRKGVDPVAVGLALRRSIRCSTTARRTGSACLLFLGIGYCVLWYLEEPHARRGAPTAARRRPVEHDG